MLTREIVSQVTKFRGSWLHGKSQLIQTSTSRISLYPTKEQALKQSYETSRQDLKYSSEANYSNQITIKVLHTCH